MSKQISSVHNPLIKHIQLLSEKSKLRKISNTFVIEGIKEIRLALAGNYKIQTLLFNHGIHTYFEVIDMFDLGSNNPEIIELTAEVYRKIAYRESTEGVIAIAESKTQMLEDLTFKIDNPLILVAEAPEKPGNIGALMRTADAAGVDAVLIADPLTDLYNPNIIRSGIGTLFTNQVAVASSSEIINFLKAKKIKIYAAALNASVPYHTCDFTKASALVVGTESTGVSEVWLEAADQQIIIPMKGTIDSMNVSVSAAILIFEACRQRGF